MATTSKLGYGNAENLDTAITNGIIDTVYDPASSNTNVTPGCGWRCFRQADGRTY